MSLRVAGRARRSDAFAVDLDLTVDAGSTVAVLGVNGSGKTTVLRAIAGLGPLESGTITVNDQQWQSDSHVLSPPQRSVGLVLAAPTLFPRMTVLDNVGYGPRSRGAAHAAARTRAAEELAAVGLADRADDRPGQLSSGQAARVALSRALATDPAVLLLDEPLSAIDPEGRAGVRSQLARRLQDYPGCTVIVTHDPLDALTLADRLVFIEDGHLVDAGPPAHVVARPRSQYAARIVGLNLLKATAAGDVVHVGETPVVVAESVPSGPCWVAIRPAAVSLWQSIPDGSPRNAWQFVVDSIDLIGQSVRIGLTGRFDLVAEVTTAALAQMGLHQGSTVWATVKASEIDAYPRG